MVYAVYALLYMGSAKLFHDPIVMQQKQLFKIKIYFSSQQRSMMLESPWLCPLSTSTGSITLGSYVHCKRTINQINCRLVLLYDISYTLYNCCCKIFLKNASTLVCSYRTVWQLQNINFNPVTATSFVPLENGCKV